MLIPRQKALISILTKDKKWYTFSEIATNLNCSTKTVQRDLWIIKELLPSQWNLKICKGKGVVLYKPADSSSSELNFLFIRHEIQFKIILAIFQQKAHTIMELSEKIYTPINSIYTHLKKVEEYLNQFKLTLKRKPLKIHGNIIDIILMYEDFFFHSYGDHEWPFNSIKEIEMYQYVINMENQLKITLYPIYRRKLMYFITIMLKLKQKNYLQIDSTITNKIIDTPFFKNIYQINQTHPKYYFHMDELGLIVIQINCSKYIYKDLKNYKKEVLQHFKKSDIPVYKHIKYFICLLENAFNHKFINNDEFIFAIIQYFKQALSKHRFLPRVHRLSENTTEYIRKQHSETFYKIWRVYKEWGIKYSIQNSISFEEIATLTLHIEGTFMISHARDTKVLLLIEDGEKWKIYIQGILNLQFGSIFQFINADIKDIYKYDYTQLNIDLIITTFINIQSKIPIIRISTIPTNRELHDIKEFIYRDSFMGV